MARLRPSRTAEGIAVNRAVEARRPEHSRVFHDPYAVHFLSERTLRLLGRPVLARLIRVVRRWQYRGMYGAVICRVRYIDDITCACLQNGAQQVVLLGAGYDMRAFRFHQYTNGARFIEVDDPDTQMVKSQKMMNIRDAPAANPVYVPMRFDRDDLKSTLESNGYDPAGKTLFIWEGVTMYLTGEQVDAILEFVVNHSGAGSSIVFDLFPASVANGNNPRREVKAIRRYTDDVGEPIRFGLETHAIEPFMRRRGFGDVRVVPVEECRERYLRPLRRRDQVSPIFTFVHATVGNSK